MTDPKLKSLAERIERLMDERDGIQSDIRDIYTEAKSAGYVPKVLRKAITRKRMDPSKRDEEDSILDLYESALSPAMRTAVAMARAGASSHKIEQATGIDHSTVARSVALNKKSATASVATNLLALKEPATASDVAPPCPAEEGSEIAGGSSMGEAPPTESLGAIAQSAGRVASPDSDDLAIPMFLRRSAGADDD